MEERSLRYVISLLARDRVGIVAEVSDTLFGLGANIEALSQTVVGDWFTMIIRAVFPPPTTAAEILDAVERRGDWQVMVAPCNAAPDGNRAQGRPYIVTTMGADKPGIVRCITRCLADFGVNIDDVWNEVRGDEFIEIFHVTVPSGVDAGALRGALLQAAGELGVAPLLQHQDIFTATSTLSVHTRR